jgi:hypothetical protein
MTYTYAFVRGVVSRFYSQKYGARCEEPRVTNRQRSTKQASNEQPRLSGRRPTNGALCAQVSRVDTAFDHPFPLTINHQELHPSPLPLPLRAPPQTQPQTKESAFKNTRALSSDRRGCSRQGNE